MGIYSTKLKSLALLFALATFGVSVWSTTAFGSGDSDKQRAAADKGFVVSALPKPQEELMGTPVAPTSDILIARPLAQAALAPAMRADAQTVTSIDDLKGVWIHSYETATSSGVCGGGSTQFTPIAGTDSVSIAYFYSNLTVKGKVDLDAQKIYIPAQEVKTDTIYGSYDIAYCDPSNGNPDRSKVITADINADGTITISDIWGIYINEGTYKDYFTAAQYGSKFVRPNGTMSFTSSGNTYTYYVRVEQPSTNVATITNVLGFGRTIELILNRDRTATIASQLVLQRRVNYNGSAVTANFKTIGNLTFSDTGSLSGYDATFKTDTATNNTTITWSNWSILSSEISTYYGNLTNTKVTSSVELTYPELSVSDFTGEGTEASPYVITKLDELILLSDRVNNVKEMNAVSNLGVAYARIYLGKYFRLDSDIDMSGYRFDPIGKDWTHIFAGTFDGNGHTITGLTIEPSDARTYTGLFGRTDTLSVIKDLTLQSPVITASYPCGSIAGWSLGTVENCHVINPSITNSNYNTGGLLGYGTIVNNCTVTGGKIKGLGGYASGIASQIENGSITNSHVYGTAITCSGFGSGYPSGGVVAYLTKSEAKNCSFAGTLDAYSNYVSCRVGGVVGQANNSSVDNCFSVGTIMGYSTDAYNGGIVGNLQSSTLTNSYSAGRIAGSGSKNTGGLTGGISDGTNAGQSTIKNCYTSAEIKAETYGYKKDEEYRELFGTITATVAPAFENVYFDNQMTNFGTPTGSTKTSVLTSKEGPTGFDASVWNFTEGLYPSLKSASADKATALSRVAILFDEYSAVNKVLRNTEIRLPEGVAALFYNNGSASYEGHYAKLDGTTITVGDSIGSDTLFITDGSVMYYHILNIAPVPFDGGGTEDAPYLIKTKSDLIQLSQITSVSKQYFPGSYFLITDDIDLEYDPNFIGIADDWTLSSCQFAGTIDGGDHTIHRMKIGGLVWETRPEDASDGLGTPATGLSGNVSNGNHGFVGRLGATGTVRNLNIAADCDFSECWAATGAIVGSLYGTIENCRNYADITGYSCWIGGIAGQTSAYSAAIRNCYNEGNISSGYLAAGGILGSGSAIIENCVNAGDITVKRLSTFAKDTQFTLAGGIIGSTFGSSLSNVVNCGNVYAATGKAGGICGSLDKTATTDYPGQNDLFCAINYGMVSTPDATTIGAVGGTSGTKGAIINTFWDGQIIPLLAHGNAALEGAAGIETAQLTSGKALEGFDADTWQFDAGVYPTLKQFANEPKMAAARQMIVNIPSGSTAADLRTNATLASVDSLTWSLADGSVFSIEGNTLKAPVTVKAVVTDTLTLAYKGLTKSIVISAAPLVPLQGQGTQESPYLINTAADWNAFADYLQSVGDSFEDKYIKVTADIAFSSETPIQQVAVDGVTSFAGTLDGDNHTISGIDITTTKTYQGIFGTVTEKGSISNLTLEGKVTGAFAYTGGLVGKLAGKLSNITTLLTVSSTKGYTGGLVGYLNTGAVLDKVVNKGTVSSSSTYVAGIAATSQGSATFTSCANLGTVKYTGTTATAVVAGLVGLAKSAVFTDCYNEGEIEVSSTATAVAGIAAIVSGDKGSDPSYFTNCYNASDITAAGLVAGITASASTSTTLTVGNARRVFNNCYNTGDITANAAKSTSNYVAAGIVGRYAPGDTIRNCYNTGTITNTISQTAGGIAGSYIGTATADYPILITNCYNSGDINASGSQGGGILGYAYAYTTVDSCYNVGAVDGTSMLGGIAGGMNSKYPVISNCYNTANVSGTLNRIGGITGYGAPTDAQITNCWNSGNVKTSSEVKGLTAASSGFAIGGIAGYISATLTNCHNTGSVAGASQVGGLVGQPYKGKTSIINCYNAGRIIADADTCGAIVGVNVTDNGKYWTADNKVEHTYYVSDLFKSENPQVGTAVTLAELAKLDMGDDWTSADDYSLPLTKHYADCDAALVNSATVVPADGETWDAITSAFHLGLPEGVTWSANALVSIEGNVGTPTGNGTVTLTAKKGEFSKKVTLTLGNASGINSITADKTVVDEVYYTTSGVRIAKPTVADGQVYIVVATYTDGSVKSFKVVNR
jgi:hypothetical protein